VIPEETHRVLTRTASATGGRRWSRNVTLNVLCGLGFHAGLAEKPEIADQSMNRFCHVPNGVPSRSFKPLP